MSARRHVFGVLPALVAGLAVVTLLPISELANASGGGRGKPFSDTVPFSKLLCLTTYADACDANSGRPDLEPSFVVPVVLEDGEEVRQLIIESVSGVCSGTGRSTYVRLKVTPDGLQTNPDTGDNFSENYFPIAVAQFVAGGGSNGAQVLSHPTTVNLQPGMNVEMTFDFVEAGNLVCLVQLHGHFVTD